MKFYLTFILFIFTNILFSQELHLDYEELIKLTLQNNLTIKTYQEKLNQAKLREKENFLGTLPQIKLSGRYSRLSEIEPFIIQLPFVPGSPILRIYEPVEEQYFTRISLDLPLFTGLRQINSIKAQKKIVDASEEELRQTKSEIIYKSKELYLKLLLAYKSLKLIEANIEFLESQRNVAQKFFENGLLQQNELLKIDIALTQARIKFYDHQNIINNLNLALCHILNIDLGTKILPSDNPDKILQNIVQEELRINQKPDILALKNLIAANEYLKKVNYGSLLPNIFLNAGYDYAKPNPKYFPVKNEWKYSWDINFVFQLTLWDWLIPLNRSRQVELQIKQMEYQLEQLTKKSEIEKIDLLNKLKNEENKIKLLELESKYANENLRIAENKFKEGLITSTDLLDANRQKVEAETKLLESKINKILLNEELKKLYGLY